MMYEKDFQIRPNKPSKPIYLFVMMFASVLSQMPMFVGVKPYRYFYYALWIKAIISSLGKFRYNNCVKTIILLTAMYDIMMGIGYVINGSGYITSGLFLPINMSAVIFICGCSYGTRYESDEVLHQVGTAYFWASVFVAAQIYLQFLKGVDYSNVTTGIVYITKNSASTVLLTSIIIEKMMIEDKIKNSKVKKMLYNFVVIAFLICIFMLKSRANILCLLVFWLIFIFIKVKSPLHKGVWIVLLGIAVLFVLNNESINKIIIHNIILNGKSTTDIYGITSGRNEHLNIFKFYFPTKWLMGWGNWYLESMPLTVLISYGIIGAIPVFALAVYPIRCYRRYRYMLNDSRLSVLVLALSLTYLTNGIFEEQSPFGPGIKCCFLWFVFGLYISKLSFQKLEGNIL